MRQSANKSIRLACMLGILAVANCGVSAADAELSFSQQRLKTAGIEPDKAGIEKYLQMLLPDANRQKEVARLILQLGDADFRVRDAATRRLAGFATPPVDALTEAAKSPDGEVRIRSKQLLQRVARGDYLSLQLAALTTIDERTINGLAPLLLKLLHRWKGPYQFRTASKALNATATLSDVMLLKTTIAAHKETTVRVACVAALVRVTGGDVISVLLRLVDDPHNRVRLEAAIGLANLKDRRCLAVLVKLLESKELPVRIRAAAVLRALTSQRFGYVAYEKSKSRSAKVRKWKTWFETRGKVAALKLPLKTVRVETGRTLYAIWSEKKIIEIDAKGKTIFEAGGYTYIWGCQGLPNGHRLVIDMSQKKVVEYDARQGSLAEGSASRRADIGAEAGQRQHAARVAQHQQGRRDRPARKNRLGNDVAGPSHSCPAA